MLERLDDSKSSCVLLQLCHVGVLIMQDSLLQCWFRGIPWLHLWNGLIVDCCLVPNQMLLHVCTWGANILPQLVYIRDILRGFGNCRVGRLPSFVTSLSGCGVIGLCLKARHISMFEGLSMSEARSPRGEEGKKGMTIHL